MRGRKNPPLPGLDDPASLASHRERYLASIEMRGNSPETVQDRRRELYAFIVWATGRGVATPADVSRQVLEDYQDHLFRLRRDDGRPLSFRTQLVRLTRIRGFFRWLAREGHIPSNPAAEMELPRTERRLPSNILSAQEAERVLNGPDVDDPLGLRDRAILELLYATAIRRSELAKLELGDIDCARGLLVVRQGKGKKDRLVPVGPRASAWLAAYIDHARPRLCRAHSGGVMFLSRSGRRLAPNKLSGRVSAYVRGSGLGKSGACHLFRHTAATLMLEGGADIRFIQAMLGHESLQTTQIYTRVSIAKLAEVHAATHPASAAARLPERAGA